MGNWLYPLSGTSGRYFVDRTGTELPDTSFASFQAMMRRPAPDEHFYLATNFKQVQVGDRVWMYYGVADGDLGVVGLGVVKALEPYPDGTPGIRFTWDKGRTRALMKAPLPAAEVRRYLPRPRAAVQQLDRFPDLVKKLEEIVI